MLSPQLTTTSTYSSKGKVQYLFTWMYDEGSFVYIVCSASLYGYIMFVCLFICLLDGWSIRCHYQPHHRSCVLVISYISITYLSSSRLYLHHHHHVTVLSSTVWCSYLFDCFVYVFYVEITSLPLINHIVICYSLHGNTTIHIGNQWYR